MKIIRLKRNDLDFIKQCDILFDKFLKSEMKYDNNIMNIKKDGSFINDIEDNDKMLYVSIENDSVVAFLYGYISKQKNEKNVVAHIVFLFVEEEYRNKKIGSSLVDYFLEEMKKIEVKIIEVKVYEENEIARKLYRKIKVEPLWTNYRKML